MWGIDLQVAVDAELIIFLRSKSVLFLLLCPLSVVLGEWESMGRLQPLRCLCWGGSSVVEAHRPARLAVAN